MAIRRGERVNKAYYARTLKLPSALKPRLDELALASGALDSQVVTAFWRTLKRSAGKKRNIVDPRRKTVFLSSGTLQKLFPNDPAGLLHSHSCDAVVDSFMDSMKSARTRKKTDLNARFPRRRKRYFKVVFKSSALRVRNGQLLLSTGDKKRPIALPWAFDLPRSVEIGWKDDGYELRAMYEDTRAVQAPLGDGVAGLDIGELRLADLYDGERVELHSGRLIRARNHYGNKQQARLDALIARKKTHVVPGQPCSKRLKRLQGARRHLRARIRRQHQDQLRKQARAVVSTLHERRVQTLAVGDLSNIRTKIDHGSRGNQQLHGWVFSKFLLELRAQSRKFGLEVVMVDEAFTSQTCPWTGARKKAKGRAFISPCGEHQMDRDGVGAVNIRAKYLETKNGAGSAYGLNPSLPWTPVLEGMAPSTRGVRFRVSHAIKRGEVQETSRIPSL
jgi:putative transposase